MTSGEIKFCLIVIFLFILPAFMWASKNNAAGQVSPKTLVEGSGAKYPPSAPAAPIRAVWTTLPASGIPATLTDCPWADITLNTRGASQGGFESWRRVCYRRPR